MSKPRFNIEAIGKPDIDYTRYVVVYRDHPDQPWLTHKAFAFCEEGKQQAIKERDTFLKERKNKLLEAHVIVTQCTEVVK